MSDPITAAAILTVLTALSPPERAATERHLPGWAETVDQRRVRLASIATDYAAVLADESPFIGGRVETAALVLAHAWHESGFARDVDVGPCYRGPGWEGRCDSGRAVCLHQVQGGRRNAELRRDRRACIRAGVAALRRSLGACRTSAPEHRLAGLSGSCSRGLAGSRRIWGLYVRRTSGLVRAAVSAERSAS